MLLHHSLSRWHPITRIIKQALPDHNSKHHVVLQPKKIPFFSLSISRSLTSFVNNSAKAQKSRCSWHDLLSSHIDYRARASQRMLRRRLVRVKLFMSVALCNPLQEWYALAPHHTAACRQKGFYANPYTPFGGIGSHLQKMITIAWAAAFFSVTLATINL